MRICEIGGGYGADACIARDFAQGIKAIDLPVFVEKLLGAYLAHRRDAAETFNQFANRHEVADLRRLAGLAQEHPQQQIALLASLVVCNEAHRFLVAEQFRVLGGPPAARSTVGVRWPDHEVARALCELLGPLAVTSANLHGQHIEADWIHHRINK